VGIEIFNDDHEGVMHFAHPGELALARAHAHLTRCAAASAGQVFATLLAPSTVAFAITGSTRGGLLARQRR
jgi:hypothetical protein